MVNTAITKKPEVLFIVPEKFSVAYGAMMGKLTKEALISLGREDEDIEPIGYISRNSQYGAACLYFLGHAGIDAQSVIVLVLFGEAGDQFNFNSSRTDSYVLGSVIIPDLAASIPTLCLPSLETGWFYDPEKWATVRSRYTDLLANGRKELKGPVPKMFVTRGNSNWN